MYVVVLHDDKGLFPYENLALDLGIVATPHINNIIYYLSLVIIIFDPHINYTIVSHYPTMK